MVEYLRTSPGASCHPHSHQSLGLRVSAIHLQSRRHSASCSLSGCLCSRQILQGTDIQPGPQARAKEGPHTFPGGFIPSNSPSHSSPSTVIAPECEHQCCAGNGVPEKEQSWPCPGGALRVVGNLPWGQLSTEQCVMNFDRCFTEAMGTQQASSSLEIREGLLEEWLSELSLV